MVNICLKKASLKCKKLSFGYGGAQHVRTIEMQIQTLYTKGTMTGLPQRWILCISL